MTLPPLHWAAPVWAGEWLAPGLACAAMAEHEIPPDAAVSDLSLGGYIAKHDRPPAFEGADGQPYTVDIDTEATNDPLRPFAAFLVFLRWAGTGAGIMEHVESADIAFGRSEDEAKSAALDLSLYEIKAELDQAIQRRRKELES